MRVSGVMWRPDEEVVEVFLSVWENGPGEESEGSIDMPDHYVEELEDNGWAVDRD